MADLISTSAVAAMHGVRRQSVARWIDAGLLPAQRGVGRAWLVDRETAAAFVVPPRGGSKPKHVGCEVPGCKRRHRAKGKCKPHYARWLHTGTTNPDKPIARVQFGQYNRTGAKQPPRQFDLDDTGEL